MAMDLTKSAAGGRRREAQMLLRLTSQERDEIASKAGAAGMTRADFVLASVRGTKIITPRDDGKIAELMRIRYELSRIGNNLNQIARQVNSAAKAHRDSVLYGELGNIDDALSAVVGWLDDMALIVEKERSR